MSQPNTQSLRDEITELMGWLEIVRCCGKNAEIRRERWIGKLREDLLPALESALGERQASYMDLLIGDPDNLVGRDAPAAPNENELENLKTAREEVAHQVYEIAQDSLAGVTTTLTKIATVIEAHTQQAVVQARVDEAKWWKYLHTVFTHCGKQDCDKCNRYADLERDLAAIAKETTK